MFAWLPLCGWTLAWSAPKSFASPGRWRVARPTSMFSQPPYQPAGIALGVFIGEARALGLHHGAAGEVLGGDEFDVLELACSSASIAAEDFGVGFGELGGGAAGAWR